MKQVNSPDDIPKRDHWVLLKFSSTSVTIPGDERSRTNPGHGYPESTETYKTYEMWVFTNEGEWKTFVEKEYRRWMENRDRYGESKCPYAAYHVDKVANLKVNVAVNIE